MEKILYIASGEIVADALRESGVEPVYAFNEAMCEGDTVTDIFSQEFVKERASAYGISENEYRPFYEKFDGVLQENNYLELFFDHDMFCAINTITLLTYLEKIEFEGRIHFNLIPQDGTAAVLKSFPITLGSFEEVYRKVLIERTPVKTGIEHLDTGILMYLEYKNPNGEIIQYIKQNLCLSRTELCQKILTDFKDYGLGDCGIFRMIDDCRGEIAR